MINKPYLTYALDADGKLIHIDSVSRGLACKCFCPHCKSELVAKNGGNLKVHHFAHANGRDCIRAIESALHKMAKDILQEHKLIMLPSIQLNGTGKQTVFSNVEAEVFNKELSLRPDCIGYTENSQFIWVEFKRTHEVDVKKAGKIISAKVDCVEIDLNSCELDPIKVKSFIENSSEGRKWIYNHENPQTFQVYEKNSSIRYHDFDYNCGFERRMPRHIAIDEQNTIVNLYNLDEIDANKHIYHWRLLKSVNAKLLNSVFMLVTRFSGLQTLSHFSNDYIGVGALKLGSPIFHECRTIHFQPDC